MKIPKTIWLLLIVVVLVALYAFSMEARTAIDGFIASTIIVVSGIVESVVVTPTWQTFFAPHIGYWGIGVGLALMGTIWHFYEKFATVMVARRAAKAPIFQGAPTYTAPQVMAPQPQQVQPNPEPKKES